MLRSPLVPCLMTVVLAYGEVAPVDIQLDRCRLHWDSTEGLSLRQGDTTILGGTSGTVVVHPPSWAWGHSCWGSNLRTTVHQEDGRPVLVVSCADEKLRWSQRIVAGPGDSFTYEYRYRQDAWDEPVSCQVCLFLPSSTWFAGAQFSTDGPGGPGQGQIPVTWEGVTHPFAGVTRARFATLFGALTVEATRPFTLFDYPHRRHFWLGWDEPLPRGEERVWSVTFTLEQQPLEVGGVRIESVSVPDRVVGESLTVAASLARTADGPEQVTARLTVLGTDPPSSAEHVVDLTEDPAEVVLTTWLPGPGLHSARLDLLAGEQTLYQSPPLSILAPRLLTISPGLIPYMDQKQGPIIARLAPEAGEGLVLEIRGPDGELHRGPVSGPTAMIPFSLAGLPQGRSEITGTLYRGQERLASARCALWRLPPRPNAVVVDSVGHGLIVDGLPFIARSYYADIATVAQTIETEATQGFNAVAPYLSGSFAERRAFREELRKLMDRCAAVGMRFHLDIRGASQPPHTEEKWEWVREEIEAFRDHPALLAYYLADEPELGWASPEDCAEAYRRIKEWDPYHPVTMVFCISEAAARYANAMDIIMTDPYPIPNGPVTNVVHYCERIRRDTSDALPLWIVPQAFGGGEWWRREPSRQEERVMTYLALIHGARGVQPFIRRPPIGNPTSPDLWSECRRLALEVGQLTPALASGETAPEVTCSDPQVHVASFKERGAVTVLAANVENQPLPVELSLDAPVNGEAQVLFENRWVPVTGGKWRDVVDGFGTRAYLIQVEPPPPDLAQISSSNMIVNPSFEEAHNVGTPDGSYLSVGADHAASWFVDPRTAVHGRQSLRLTTPTEGQGLGVSPFPISLEPGRSYRLSVWAKGNAPGLHFALTLDAVDSERGTHTLTTDWQEYAVKFVASERGGRGSPYLRLLSPGTAWFDALQLVPIGP